MMFESAAFCPACGVRRVRTTGAVGKVRCPACRTLMRDVQLGPTQLLECEGCGGIWVDAPTFEHVCADRDARAAVLHRWPSPERRPIDTNVHYRPCAACGKMMNRLNFGRLSGTIIDVCKGHGTFLDAGELHQLVTFIQGGGLERARERQMDDLKEEGRRLRAQPQTGLEDQPLEPPSWSGFDLLSLVEHLSRR
jgi:Zn-finger nucleic acid-binding protein